MVPSCEFPPSHFHCALGFATQTLAHMLDSLVRVSRRAGCKHFVLVQATLPGPMHGGLERVSRSRSNATSLSAVCRAPNRRELRNRCTGWRSVNHQKMQRPDTACNRFPFSDFRHSLTLFSKFFASFPHGTCSLSVSRQYLALEGIYLPLRAAVPSNSTLRKNGVRAVHEATNGTVTLHGSLFQGNWTSPALPRLLETTIRALTAGFSD